MPAQRVQQLDVLLHTVPLLGGVGGLVLVLCRQNRHSRSLTRAGVAFGLGLLFVGVAATLALEAVRVVDWLRVGGPFLLGVLALVAGWQSVGGQGPQPKGPGESRNG